MRFAASSGISLFCVPLTAAATVLVLLSTAGDFCCWLSTCLSVIETTGDEGWSFVTDGGLGDFLKPVFNQIR